MRSAALFETEVNGDFDLRGNGGAVLARWVETPRAD
jgi:hypothetical protein